MYLYREGLAQFPTALQPSKLTRSGYKAFALRVKGHGRDLLATCSCWGLPIGDECRQRVEL
jgi:hypothetical protein